MGGTEEPTAQMRIGNYLNWIIQCVFWLWEKQKLNFRVVIKDLGSKYLQIVVVWRTDADIIANGNRNVIVGVRNQKKPQGIFVESSALKMIYGWFKKETRKIRL